MRVVMISKALVVGTYQRKCEEIAAHPDVDLTVVAPTAWAGQRYEPGYVQGYRTLVQPIRFDGKFHVFYFPTLRRILRDLRPDVVHIDEEPYNLATVLATRQSLAVGARPIFFTWQNLQRAYPPPFRWFEQYVYSRSRFAIAGNSEAVDVLRAKGYGGPTAVIPQFGVDPDLFAPAGSQAERGDRPFTIGYVGRFTPEKGLSVLLDAVAALQGDWHLRLIGAGEMRDELASRSASRGIANRVSLESYVPSTEVPARLRQLDVLVLPSLTTPRWKEQFGRVLQEAMSCGVPVVGSDSGEIPHVVGDAGLIVREGDADALCAALTRLEAAPWLRHAFGERGRQRVLERFTHARIAAQTVAVYQDVHRSP